MDSMIGSPSYLDREIKGHSVLRLGLEENELFVPLLVLLGKGDRKSTD
jgi:hypothetical protein